MGISIGVVGAGQFAGSFIPLYKAHPDVDEVRLVEVMPERLKAEAEKHEIEKTYPSIDDLLETDVDAVAIFTQRWTHGPLALQALRAGKHVYSSVPMAYTIDEIAAIIDEVKRSGLTYAMGETSHYYPASVFARVKRADGAFGRIFYAEGDYVHDMDHGFYEAYQYSGGDRWKETASFPPMHYPTHAVGSVLSVTDDWATHVSCVGVPDERGDGVFDKSVSLFDNDISNATALFKTASGGSFRTNEFRRVGYHHGEESRTRIFGTEAVFEQLGTVSMFQDKEHLEEVTKQLKPVRSKSLDDPELANVDPALRENFVSGMAPVHDRSRLPDSFIGLPNGHQGSHQFLADDFIRACVTGKLAPVNAWRSARYTAPGIIAHESALQGGVQLEIPDFGDEPGEVLHG